MNKLKGHKLGIIIPFYEGDEFIMKCIRSLNTLLLPENFNIQIIIVDNSRIKSQYQENLQSEKNIIYLKTKPAIGYGRACNIGTQKAIEKNCDFICLLNQDTIIDNLMVTELLKVLLLQPELTVCSPMIFNYDFESPMETVVTTYLLKNKDFFKDIYAEKTKNFYEIPTICAACILMRTTVAIEIGLYDPVLYLYGEDYDFFERLKRKGGKLLLVTKAKLAHRASMNETDLAKQWITRRYYEEAQLIKIVRFNKRDSYLNKTIKTAWMFLRNKKIKPLIKYLKGAMLIYLRSKQYLLTSNQIIKERIMEQQKRDIDL